MAFVNFINKIKKLEDVFYLFSRRTSQTWLMNGEKEIHSSIRRKTNGHEGYSFFNNLNLVRLEGLIVVVICIILWIVCTETETKISVILMSLTYSYIEFSWYMFTYETIDRVVHIAPLHVKGRKGFTTVEQLIGNILYLPISMNGYALIFNILGSMFPVIQGLLLPLRILLFPLNIWLLEIVQHELFKFIFGFNPAWDYTGAPGSRCDGAINLAHAKLWIFLGILAATCTPLHGIYIMLILLTTIHLVKFIALYKYSK